MGETKGTVHTQDGGDVKNVGGVGVDGKLDMSQHAGFPGILV